MSDSNGPGGAVLPNQAVVTEPRGAFDLRDDIHIKLAQAKGICRVIHGGGDLAVIGKASIQASLWVVDELLDDAKKAVDELYQQLTSTEKGGS